MSKMPENEWLVGKLYSYNKDYDQTKREIKRLIESGDFVADDDYDEEGYITIPVEVRYKIYVDESLRGRYAQNARNTTKSKQIEISDTSVTLKTNDRFKTQDMTDEEKGYKVTIANTNGNSAYTMATYMLPGLYNEYNSNQVVTLQ